MVRWRASAENRVTAFLADFTDSTRTAMGDYIGVVYGGLLVLLGSAGRDAYCGEWRLSRGGGWQTAGSVMVEFMRAGGGGGRWVRGISR